MPHPLPPYNRVLRSPHGFRPVLATDRQLPRGLTSWIFGPSICDFCGADDVSLRAANTADEDWPEGQTPTIVPACSTCLAILDRSDLAPSGAFTVTDGTGTYAGRDCTRCDGLGVLPSGQPETWDDCPSCEGLGIVADRSRPVQG